MIRASPHQERCGSGADGSLQHPHAVVPWTSPLCSRRLTGDGSGFPPGSCQGWTRRSAHLQPCPRRRSHRTHSLHLGVISSNEEFGGPFTSPGSGPARFSPCGCRGRTVSQARALLFPSPTKLQGNVSEKKRFNIFSDLLRTGRIHQNAKGDSCRSSSASRTGTAHPNPETAVTPHRELNKHLEKAHISPKIKVL